jgi:hypothetical protein
MHLYLSGRGKPFFGKENHGLFVPLKLMYPDATIPWKREDFKNDAFQELHLEACVKNLRKKVGNCCFPTGNKHPLQGIAIPAKNTFCHC